MMSKYRTDLPQLTMTTFMTDSYVSYYMINCAHPDHFKGILNPVRVMQS